MARRRKDEGIVEMLYEILEFIFRFLPPWTSIPFAVVGFFIIVVFWDSMIKIPVLQIFGLMFGFVFAAICLIAGWKGIEFRRNQQAFLKADIDLNWVRGLSWRGFEKQLAEVYRQKGYEVEETGGGGPDGGIDLKLHKDGQTAVVQCKHWKTWKVNVKPVRELFGVMTAEGADSAIFIISGSYTSDALRFAEGKPIELIDQRGFLELVRHFQRELQKHYGVESSDQNQPPAFDSKITPQCPHCNSPMKLRTAKKGKTAGSQFWGCSKYPDCRGTLNYQA
jgi:restriction system protein